MNSTAMNKTSQRGVDLIKSEEGFRSRMYNDEAGNCTIGYGHLIHLGPIDGRTAEIPFEQGISIEEACALLMSDIRAKAEHFILVWVKVALNQNQYDALSSFVFNIGGHQFSTSTLLVKLNNGDYAGAAEQFDRWNHDGGKVSQILTKRRAIERALFESTAVQGASA